MKHMAILVVFLLAPLGAWGQSGTITPDEAAKLLDQNKKTVLMDVRTEQEFYEVRIPGAINLPVDKISGPTAAQFIPAKNTTVIVYCRSGARSAKAAAALKNLGYTTILDMGGIKSWPYKTIKGKPEEK